MASDGLLWLVCNYKKHILFGAKKTVYIQLLAKIALFHIFYNFVGKGYQHNYDVKIYKIGLRCDHRNRTWSKVKEPLYMDITLIAKHIKEKCQKERVLSFVSNPVSRWQEKKSLHESRLFIFPNMKSVVANINNYATKRKGMIPIIKHYIKRDILL